MVSEYLAPGRHQREKISQYLAPDASKKRKNIWPHLMNKPEHHSIDRLKERGMEKGSGRHSTLQGRERSVFNQTNIGTVSRATLGRLLRDGAERVWAFPSATMPSWAETETETWRQQKEMISEYLPPPLPADDIERKRLVNIWPPDDVKSRRLVNIYPLATAKGEG